MEPGRTSAWESHDVNGGETSEELPPLQVSPRSRNPPKAWNDLPRRQQSAAPPELAPQRTKTGMKASAALSFARAVALPAGETHGASAVLVKELRSRRNSPWRRKGNQ